MPDFIFDFVFKYVWFIFGFISLAQLIFVPARANAIATRVGENSETVRTFLLGYQIFITLSYFVLGGIQMLGGFENAFYFFFAPLENPFVVAVLLFLLLYWLFGAYWIYFRDGAKTMVRYGFVRGFGSSERGIKIFMAVGLVFGFIWLLLGRLFFPGPPF